MTNYITRVDTVPRAITVFINVATLAIVLAFLAWATNTYAQGGLTPGNWLTIIGMLAGLVSTVALMSFWLSTLASRVKSVAELMVRLESSFNKHIVDDDNNFAKINDKLDGLK